MLLAPFSYSKQKNWAKLLTTEALPALWEAQIHTLAVPHPGLITTTDRAGSAKDIHPTNKRDVGFRLARLALLDTYGRSDIAASSPRFKAARPIAGGKMEVKFEHAGGLPSRDGAPLGNFLIAGEDRHFQPTEAVILGDRVIVFSPLVAKSVAVRFGWSETTNPSLVNGADLPAFPFRTDDWPLQLELPKPAPTPAAK